MAGSIRRLTFRPALWPVICAVMAVGALVAWPLPTGLLDWQPLLSRTAPWRAFTAPFIQFSAQHLFANLAGCAVLAGFGWAARLPRRAALAWALAWPLTQWGLLIEPALLHFGGLSGVLHAGVAVGVVELLLMRCGRERWIGLGIAIGLASKLLFEHPLSAPTQRVDGWDIAIAPLAHLTGTLSGVLCALLCILLSKLKRR